MNYRHLFHAGNFADVLKHALLLQSLAHLTSDPEPLQVLDTHAGAGLYDLAAEEARRSGEADAGVGRLMGAGALPAALERLRAAVEAANPGGALRWYPGSPRLACAMLRSGDGWTGCELRAEEAQALRRALPASGGPSVRVVEGDGYAQAAHAAPGRRLVLIDPPFERADEPDRIAETLRTVLRDPRAAAMVWLPLKDLDSYDRLLSRVEASDPPPSLAVQARLRPLTDPMRMNGTALLLLGGGLAEGLEGPAREAAAWIAAGSADGGGRAVVERFGGSRRAT